VFQKTPTFIYSIFHQIIGRYLTNVNTELAQSLLIAIVIICAQSVRLFLEHKTEVAWLCATLRFSFDPWSRALCRFHWAVAGGARPEAVWRRDVRMKRHGNFVVIMDSTAKQVPSKNHVLSYNRLSVSDLLSVKRFRLIQNTH